MLSVWKHWAAQTPQLHVYSSDHLCELHPYVLYFKRPFQLLLSFHSEIPFKSGLRAWVCFFNPHIVGTGQGNFPHCACSGYPAQRWNAECWLSKCRALCELTTSVPFNGEQGWAKRKPKTPSGFTSLISARHRRCQVLQSSASWEKYRLRCWTAVGYNPGFATFSLGDVGKLLGRTIWNRWQLTIFTHNMEISHSSPEQLTSLSLFNKMGRITPTLG